MHESRQIKSIVSANVRAARAASGLTQGELAHALGVKTPMTVSRWERGRVVPSLENLNQLAELAGRDISWFYTDHGLEVAA